MKLTKKEFEKILKEDVYKRQGQRSPAGLRQCVPQCRFRSGSEYPARAADVYKRQGHSRGAKADTAGHKRAALFTVNGVLVGSNVYFCLLYTSRCV